MAASGTRCPHCLGLGHLSIPGAVGEFSSTQDHTDCVWGRSDSSRKIRMLFPVKGGKRLGRQKQQMSTPTAFQLTIHRRPGASSIQRTEKEADFYRFNYLYFLSEGLAQSLWVSFYTHRLVTFTPYLQACSICWAHLPKAWSSAGPGQIAQESLLCPPVGAQARCLPWLFLLQLPEYEWCCWSQKQGLGRVLTDGHQSSKHCFSETWLSSPVLLSQMLAPWMFSGTCGSWGGC